MRKMTTTTLLLALAVALPALAGDHTVTLTAAQETKATAGLLIENALTCSRLALQAGCSDAQAKAKDPNAAIYATVDAMIKAFAIEAFLARKTTWDAQMLADFQAAREAASAAQKNSACTAVGLASGCLP